MSSRRSGLRLLLDAFEMPGSCFILGAGASAPLVPMGAELGRRVRQRMLSTGIFPVTAIPRDKVSERILGSFRSTHEPCSLDAAIEEQIVSERFSNSAVHAAAIAILRPPHPVLPPPQYAVFSLSRHRVSIVNFNVDGFAELYCADHRVVAVHGTSLSHEQRETFQWDRWIDIYQEFPGLKLPRVPNLLLPQPEPSSIFLTVQYLDLRECLLGATRLVFIGYSFGAMDDLVAYSHVITTIRLRRPEIAVLLPRPESLVTQLQEDARTANIAPLDCYWDKLSAAIIISPGQPRKKTCNHERFCVDCIDYLYEGLLDAS